MFYISLYGTVTRFSDHWSSTLIGGEHHIQSGGDCSYIKHAPEIMVFEMKPNTWNDLVVIWWDLMGFSDDLMGFSGICPLVMTNTV